MDQTFEPRICAAETGEAPTYKGTVTIRRPNYDERLSLLEEGEVDVEPGDTKETLTEKLKPKKYKMTRTVLKRLPEFFVSADVTRLSDGRKFVVLDDFQYDTDLQSVLNEIVGKLVGRYIAGEGVPLT
jgi:hypothetical protein